MRSSTVIEFDFEAKMFLRRVLLGGGWRAMSTQVGKKVKETTGIVGLDVVPNAREVLISLYTRTLREIQVVPPDEGYRKAVESFTRQRLNVCLEEDDWEEIENRLGCGQVEELIEEAKDELTLISKMIEYSVTILILGVCLRALRHYVTAEGRTFKRLIERIIPWSVLWLTMSDEDDTAVYFARWVRRDGILGKLKWGFLLHFDSPNWVDQVGIDAFQYFCSYASSNLSIQANNTVEMLISYPS
ncbi:hypothetical protein ZIOFF_060757 [Zingiber officinale]|uniref:Uncharacterized protein n=1 Tax=Zingiber officinale TaxID=94328 RepID=A0A8J5KL97_ZINOF|nr:hypothetical protein ZIOFF_060757 [Zingiber officinale]